MVTSDQSTLIVAETSIGTLTSFEIADDGSLHDRHIWAHVPDVHPDVESNATGVVLARSAPMELISPDQVFVPRVPTSRGGGGARMLTLQEMSDRFEIQDLLVAEGASIDERDWDRWESLYTPDADVDWSGNSGARGNPKEVRAWAEPVLSTENFPYPAYQHYCTNFQIRVTGDTASSRHLQIIPISILSPGGGRQIAFSGIWFDDQFVRASDGWKICARREQLTWNHNFPETFEVPQP